MQESALKVKENDTEELSNSMFLDVMTILFSDFPKLFREELLGFSNLA